MIQQHLPKPSGGATPITAAYSKSLIASQRGNPLIEALPTIKSDQEWLDQLLIVPPFDVNQRADEAHIRAYNVVELKDVFLPSDRHLLLARRLDQLIRWGYRKRNPLLPERALALQKSYEKAQGLAQATKMAFSEGRPISNFSLIGVSGMGKSTSTEAVLGAYPQYIFHPEHALFQIVWLKVECPKDGSVKELAMNILRAFDRVLGTDHTPKNSRNVTATFLTNMVNHLANAYCLGMLILDEIQNLSVKKSGGREEMLNFFQELVNDLRLPVVILGTFKAMSVLQLDMRHSRRTTSSGSSMWRPMPYGEEFRFLLEGLWDYMWLRNAGALSEELEKTIFEETQGIHAFVVDMFVLTQLRALRMGLETITPEMFKDVARTEFEPVQPVLNALRSKKPGRLTRFEDVESYDIDELIERELNLVKSNPQAPGEAGSSGTSLAARATANVRSTLGLHADEARKLVNNVLDGSHKSVQALTKAALQRYFELTESSEFTHLQQAAGPDA